MIRTLCTIALLLLFSSVAKAGTPTENHGIRALPTPGPVTVDGKESDWDLSGGMYICGNGEKNREHFYYWVHLMYDKDNLYLLARVRDLHPLGNQGIVGSDNGFLNDCFQFRIITNYNTAEERVAHFTAWQGKNNADIIDVTYGRKFDEGKMKDAQEKGAEMVFSPHTDGKGYNQEIRLPLELIAKGGKALGPGAPAVITFELFFAPGNSCKDNFRTGVNPDRIFTFRAYENWGTVTFSEKGNVPPGKVRLADGREFPVAMVEGKPVVDWTGLVKDPFALGFKDIAFEMPMDGYASLHIRNSQGKVIRQFLNYHSLYAGKHSFAWDGLDDLEGKGVPPGTYTWHGIAHPGLDIVLRGWASNGGSVPWDSDKTSNWGGDHGVPSDCDSEGENVILGWTGAEAGKAVVLTDLDGKVKWRHIRGGMGGAECVSLDGDTVYVLDHGHTIYRLDLTKGEPSFWSKSASADLEIKKLLEGLPNAPGEARGIEAHDGILYVSFTDTGLPRIKDALILAKLLGNNQGLGATILSTLKTDLQNKCKDLAAGKEDPRFKPTEDMFRKQLLGYYNSQMEAIDLTRSTRDAAVRPILNTILEAFPGVFEDGVQSNFIAMVDGHTGSRIKTIPVPSPRRLRMGPDNKLYVLSEEDAVIQIDPANGTCHTVVSGLRTARGLSLDKQGQIYVAVRGPDNQVKVFGSTGTLLRSLGKQGGRTQTGPWDPSGMLELAAVAVDDQGRAWITEEHNHPKRFALYNSQSGEFLKEFFGPAHYGASGGAINPLDPNVMVGEGCEWRLNPETGSAICTGVYAREIPSFARFCEGANGRLYLATNQGREGRVCFYERLGEGRYALRAEIRDESNTATRFWSDANDDQEEQPDEVEVLPYTIGISGYVGWSMGVNTDLSLWGPTGKPQTSKSKRGASNQDTGTTDTAGQIPPAVCIKLKDFTACNAPRWNLQESQTISVTAAAPLPSPDGNFLLGYSSEEKSQWQGIDVKTGEVQWNIANGWHGVHGSHRAPPPAPGLIRGAFGLIGCVKGPEATGHIWAINSNVGEWHLLTETGFYLSTLFQSDLLEVKWPKTAEPGTIINNIPSGAGAEDFGGTMIQDKKGTIFLQSGKVAFWNAELKNVEKVKSLAGGIITITEEDARQAAAVALKRAQEAVGTKTIVLRQQGITFTGNIDKDFGSQSQKIDFQKKADSRVSVYAAYDSNHLYLGWHVRDTSPWVNGADAPHYMYARGDTVDFQLGTLASAEANRKEGALGDLRLSIGSVKGKPIAVIYREKANEKLPMTFSSGVIKSFPVDSVQTIEDIEIRVNKGSNEYVVEAKIPLKTLNLEDLKGKSLHGDFGVTHGDNAGTDTVLRTYWNNQQTGLVSDEVFELKVEPVNWGRLTFE